MPEELEAELSPLEELPVSPDEEEELSPLPDDEELVSPDEELSPLPDEELVSPDEELEAELSVPEEDATSPELVAVPPNPPETTAVG